MAAHEDSLPEDPALTGQYTETVAGGERVRAYVPRRAHLLRELLGNLEEFLRQPGIPVFLKAAFAHVQFETIHPFLDGNGRLGRRGESWRSPRRIDGR